MWIRSSNFSGDTLPFSNVVCVPNYTTITSFDPVSDSTPAAVVTEIDEESAFIEAHDSLRVLLSQGKRQRIEMNASGIGREDGAVGSTVPWLAITAGGGMQVKDDIGDLDETQVQEFGSKRHKEGNAAEDLLKALTSRMIQDAVVRMAERDAAAAATLAERDAALAAKLESLVRTVSESVDPKIKNLSACVEKKMDNKTGTRTTEGV